MIGLLWQSAENQNPYLSLVIPNGLTCPWVYNSTRLPSGRNRKTFPLVISIAWPSVPEIFETLLKPWQA